MDERELLSRLLKPLARDPAARQFADDAAVFTPALGRQIILTHDVIACGVHYLPSCPPSNVAWKLLAVNLSDLAAKGARPVGVLLGLGVSAQENENWLTDFVKGLDRALTQWDCPLLGGDTVMGLQQAVLGMTALGDIPAGAALDRRGAQVGDDIYVSGTIGDAALGLQIAQGQAPADKYLLARYRRPVPRLDLGQALVGQAHACMDVSDGLWLDAQRMAEASAVAFEIYIPHVPLSEAARARRGDDDAARLWLGGQGDDYELLWTASPAERAALDALGAALGLGLARIGQVQAGSGVRLIDSQGQPRQPARWGYAHGAPA